MSDPGFIESLRRKILGPNPERSLFQMRRWARYRIDNPLGPDERGFTRMILRLYVSLLTRQIRRQEQMVKVRRKHTDETYIKTVEEFHTRFPWMSFNFILRQAAKELQVTSRTVRRHFPKKNW